MIDQLAARLRADFGRGFTPSNMRYMRLFYLAYPNLLAREIHHAVRDKSEREAGALVNSTVTDDEPPTGVLDPDLSWTHDKLLYHCRRRIHPAEQSREHLSRFDEDEVVHRRRIGDDNHSGLTSLRAVA